MSSTSQHLHVAVVAFPFSSHAPKLLAVARALATAAPSVTISFLSTADSLARLPATAAVVPGNNLRFVEMPSGGGGEDDGEGTPAWRRMEMFVEAAEGGGLKRALEMAGDEAGGARVSCVVGDAFMSMAAEAGVPWVAVWTGGPCALLAHLVGDALREDIGDGDYGARGDELLTSYPGLGCYRVRDLPLLGGAGTSSGDMHRVMTLLLCRVAQRLPGAATAVAFNAFPGLFPPDVSAAIADALPNCLPIGPYHFLPGAAVALAPDDDDPHGCLAWLADRPACSVAYVSFGTVAAPPPDELRELACGLEATGAPFLWSLREESWPLLPPGFLDRAKNSAGAGLVVPWTPQAAVLRHPAVGAFVTHSGWGAVVEGISGGVPMVCRPFLGDQHMNARAVARLWCFGTAFDGDGTGKPLMTRGGVAEAVASLLAGEEEEARMMRARARDLQSRMVSAFELDGGSTKNFHKFVEIVCARV
ncbi:anthocyanidin 3-O-glucosyltransferase-like [Oryza brachyantha]|uniref:anthocyanidin 3-O-glucosyltransferase-like n=1 Tax=Oryza brachyantha TaxID=4533 RepID=UPI001AD99F48|nr:anthocyanidin 3-O-glucosyltransferase-like [Oryza brachyantha]